MAAIPQHTPIALQQPLITVITQALTAKAKYQSRSCDDGLLMRMRKRCRERERETAIGHIRVDSSSASTWRGPELSVDLPSREIYSWLKRLRVDKVR